MKTVKEVSRITGVSVRTLHYYDAIGLLKPAEVTAAGYRLYDDAALGRLYRILLFRELQFPLKEIRAILDSPEYNPKEALEQQIHLLEIQYKHIGELISFARELQKKGVEEMSFQVFDKSEAEAYKKEVKERWAGTTAYQEYEERKNRGQDFEALGTLLMELFRDFGRLSEKDPGAAVVQEKVRNLQKLLTEHCYTCTPEILKGLGQMYAEDPRFKKKINDAAGEGTAEFVAKAIEHFCSA